MRLRDLIPKVLVYGCSEIPFPQLGHGHYSRVFELSSRHVLKVSYNDSYYDRFVDLVLECNNPVFPRVYVRRSHGSRRVYVLERLRHYETEEEHKRAIDLDHAASFGNLRLCPCENTLMAITMLRERGLFGDLHDQNVMFRSNGQIVITDPVS